MAHRYATAGTARAARLPSHVQNAMSREERLLQQGLDDLERQTTHAIRCISQDQQVVKTKLRILQKRLAVSQARASSQALESKFRSRAVSCGDGPTETSAIHAAERSQQRKMRHQN